ncbi:MAG TPA: hypothetical protein P5056_00570 [Candidatus Paceibacterota bacterium]|nr:hypothetical protein [Candidatus Paceibacterota bacterium]
MSHKKHLLLLTLLSIVFAPGLYFSHNDPIPAIAQSGSNKLSGWAWSSNVGWISFNSDDCTTSANFINNACGGNGIKKLVDSSGTPITYGVTLDSSNNLVGYAWNPDLGYIYFGGDSDNAGGIESAPEAPKTWARLSGNAVNSQITGWARACSVFASGCNGALKSNIQRGDWDGWIKMSDDAGTIKYGAYIKDIATNGQKIFGGFAWGGGSNPAMSSSAQFPGWINFDYKTNPDGTPVTPGCVGQSCQAGCTENCGGVVVPPSVGPETFFVPRCLSELAEGVTVVEPNKTLTFSVNPEGPGNNDNYTIRWFDDGVEKPGQTTRSYTLTTSASVPSHNITVSVVPNPAGGVAVRTLSCTPGGLTVAASPTASLIAFSDLNLMNMSVILPEGAIPVTAKNISGVLPKITIIDATGSPCSAQITLSVEKITKNGVPIPEVHWKKSTAPNQSPVFSPKNLISVGSSSNLTLNIIRQPAGTTRLSDGTYSVNIKASPAGGACGGDRYRDAALKISSTGGGGTYIEE